MKFYSLISDAYDVILLPETPMARTIGPLPQGIYNYNLSFRNPYPSEAVVSIEFLEGEKSINQQVLRLHSPQNYFTMSFEVGGKKDCSISICLIQGKEALVELPVSPTLPHKNMRFTEPDSDLIDLVRKDLIAYQSKHGEDGPKNLIYPALQVVQQPLGQNTAQEDSLHIRLQHLLTFEQAERQLDYVVLHKLFAPNDAKGFQKWKRTMYRKLVQFLYRKLLAGKSRKNYIVKLYRNYQNNNILSEPQP